jgi:DNA processing protein
MLAAYFGLVESDCLDEHTLRYWIGFNRAKGIGPARLNALIQHCGGIEAAWNASPKEWQAAGLDQRTVGSLKRTRETCNLDAELRAVERLGARVITFVDDEYPPLLRQIYDPPPILYVKGTLTKADHWAIAVVGTRRATAYGKTMAQTLVAPLVQRGLTIVSGLARGIDAIAHQTALEAGGRTIAVMANGIDQVYPPEHRELAAAITEQGALITEHPVGEEPEAAHFIPRNRIVSGLCLGTVVVEAAETSGALKTANLALDQGREVFAVPGNALAPTSKGPNALIQAGAKMITSADDILNELKIEGIVPKDSAKDRARRRVANTALAKNAPSVPLAPPVADSARGEAAEAAEDVPTSQTEALVLRYLSATPQHVDELTQQCGLSVAQVTTALTLLELRGLIENVGAMQYIRVS